MEGDNMRKKLYFLSLMTITFFILLSSIFLSSNLYADSPKFKINITFSGDEKLLTDTKSFVLRELRSINDIEITDQKAWWKLDFITLKNYSGYLVVVNIIMPIDSPTFGFYSNVAIAEVFKGTPGEEIIYKPWLLKKNFVEALKSQKNDLEFLWGTSVWFARDINELHGVILKMINTFDANYLEPEREQAKAAKLFSDTLKK
jgi:hypothetical protein